MINSSVKFMDLINRVFKQLLDDFVTIFTINMQFFYKNPKDHAHHLRKVFQNLRKHRLYARFSKCKFWLRSISFSGHMVLENKFEVYLEKVEVAANTNIGEKNQEFLGLWRLLPYVYLWLLKIVMTKKN